MKYKIGFMGPKNLEDESLLNKLNDICELVYIKCDNVTDEKLIGDTYRQNIHKVDGLILSGLIQYTFLKKQFNNFVIPVSYLKLSERDFYKYMFRILDYNRQIDFSRVFIDFLRDDNNYYDIFSVKANRNVPYTINDFSIYQNMNEIDRIYEEALIIHKKLWEEKKIDLSVTRSYKNYEILNNLGYKCDYLFPSNESIIKTFDNLISMINLEKMDMNKPATCIVTINSKEFLDEDFIFKMDKLQARLYDIIIEFLNNNDIYNATVLHQNLKIEISTTKENILKMTSNYQSSTLLNFIKMNMNININLGYGIGNTAIHSSKNAILANKTSSRNGGNCLYIIDDSGKEYGPIYESQEEYIIENNYLIDKISERIPLSKTNISKIINIMEERQSNEITGEILSEYMKITVRSANRILNTLCTYDMAQILEYKQENRIGRPKRIYKLDFSRVI